MLDNCPRLSTSGRCLCFDGELRLKTKTGVISFHSLYRAWTHPRIACLPYGYRDAAVRSPPLWGVVVREIKKEHIYMTPYVHFRVSLLLLNTSPKSVTPKTENLDQTRKTHPLISLLKFLFSL